MSTALSDAISSYTVDQLKKLGALLPGRPEGTRKAHHVEFVTRGIRDGLDDLVAQLDPLQRAAIAHVVHGGWEAYDRGRFRAIHGRLPDWGPASSYSWYGSDGPSVLRLFFSGDTIPQELHARLRDLVEPVPERELRAHDAPSPVAVAGFDYETDSAVTLSFEPHLYLGEQIALSEVAATLTLAARGKLTVTAKTKMPTAATVRNVSKVLAAPEPLSDPEEWSAGELEVWLEDKDREVGPVRAHALAWLVLGSKLTRGKGLSRKGKALLTAPAHEVVKEVWSQWCDQDAHDEFQLVHHIKGYAKAKRNLTKPSWRRARLIEALRDLEVGGWVEVGDWLRQMQADQRLPDVASSGRGAWELYVDHANYGSLGYDEQHLEVLVPTYTRAFLFACAASLGIVDLAYVSPEKTHCDRYWWSDSVPYLSPFDGLASFRLTPLGAWVLGMTGSYTPGSVASIDLRVLPNRDVVLLGDATPGVSSLLDVYATPREHNTWHLEREALLVAIEAGHDLERLRAFLTEHNPEPLPPAVAALLEDVSRRAGAVTAAGKALLFEVSDPVVAAEVAHDRFTKDLCMLVGDRTLVVSEGDESKFRVALRKLGYVSGF